MGKGTSDRYHSTQGASRAFHALTDNLASVTKTYPLRNGYFAPRAKSNYVRRMECENPLETAKDFYDKLSAQAVSRTPIPGQKGEYAKMTDGSVITYRSKSNSDGSPAAEIKIVKENGRVKGQKIHFIKKESKS